MIGEHHPNLPRSRIGLESDIEQVQHTLLPVRRPVRKGQHAAQLINTGMLDAFGTHIALALQEKAFRRADDHVHGIDLLNDRQQIGLGRHQPALVRTRPLNHAADGGHDQRVIEIEFRLHQLGLRAFKRSLGGQFLGDRIIHILRTDRLFSQQRLHAGQVLLGLNQPCFRLRHFRLRTQHRGMKGHRIDLIQAIPFFHLAAFFEEPCLENARHL